MRFRRRDAIKALLLALTVVTVLTFPLWTLSGFLYACAFLVAVVAIVFAGALLNLYIGFRIFEYRIDELARRFHGKPKPFLRLIANRGRR